MVGKQKMVGRGYSREVVTEFTLNEWKQYISQAMERARKETPWLIKKGPDGKESFAYGGVSLLELIDDIQKEAEAYLHYCGLPSCKVLYKWADDDWREERPEPEADWRTLLVHIQALGNDRDSLPYLAAQILRTSQRIKELREKDDIDKLASECIDFGRFCERWKVYSKTDSSGAKGGRADKSNKWAPKVAKMISKWREIPEVEEYGFKFHDVGIDSVYRDGDTLIAIGTDGKSHKLARSTFEKRYLRKNNK